MFIKRPNSYRASYALIGRDGKTRFDPRIDAINRDLKAGFPIDLLESRVKAVLASFRLPQTPISMSNEALVNRCHTAKLKMKTDLADPDNLKYRLMRAAEAVGEVSILEASEDSLYNAFKGPLTASQTYELRRGINELLKFAGRPIKLYNPRPKMADEIVYIRIEDFSRLENKLKRHHAVYLGALFATGCRFAELPVAGLTQEQADVRFQLKPNNPKAPTKNKKKRIAPVLPPLNGYVEDYLKLPKELRYSMCLTNHKQLLYQCKKALGVKIHDLRHSYAVEWTLKGCTVQEVALYIGDTEEVTQLHYRPQMAVAEQISRALSKWK